MIHDFSQSHFTRKAALDDAALIGIDLNEVEPVEDFLPETMLKLSRRIERSTDYEQLIYREVELDEVWRLIDGAIAEAHRVGADPAALSRLEDLRAGTIDAHDLLIDPAMAGRAAARLRGLMNTLIF